MSNTTFTEKATSNTNMMNEQDSLSINTPAAIKFRKDMLSWFKQRLFLFTTLPSAWFMGVRIKSIDTQSCTVTLPYKWASQNPFKSIYFAAQAAAAELSTGALAMAAIQGQPPISMSVADMRAEFIKKGTKLTSFVCTDAHKIYAAIAQTLKTGEGVTVTVESIGTQQDGTIISKFYFTWTLKAKVKKQ